MSGDVKRYQVVAPMVVADSATPQGIKLQNFYRHAILPQDVSPRKIELLLRRRLIIEVAIDAQGHATPVPAEPVPAEPPAKAGRAGAGAKSGG